MPPTLVGASLDGGVVTLAFDRAIDVAAFDPSTIVVDDGASHATLGGGGEPTLVTPTTVAVEMESLAPFAGSGVTLNVGAGNGIVAVDGGMAWAGCSAVALPFG